MKELFKKLIQKESLSEEETYFLICQMMRKDGEISDHQIAAYLTATAMRSLEVDELVGAARALRENMLRVQAEGILVDTCGTGGSGFDSFNTSTASAFVAAAVGLKVAKHGNRAASSRCGSADVLAALGLNLDLEPEKLSSMLEQAGFCFMFAPNHHPATKRVVIARKSLGFRTIFNFLGPLSNPAGAKLQVLGVSSKEMQPLMAEALLKLGAERALIVRGVEGLDEISTTAETDIYEVKEGAISHYQIKPEDFGLARVGMEEVRGFLAKDAGDKVKAIYAGEKSAYRDIVVLNAGAAFYVAGKAESIADGVSLASEVVDSGKALEALQSAIGVSNSL